MNPEGNEKMPITMSIKQAIAKRPSRWKLASYKGFREEGGGRVKRINERKEKRKVRQGIKNGRAR